MNTFNAASKHMTSAEREELFDEFRARLIFEMTQLTRDHSHPTAGPISEFLRNLPTLQWNSKVLGSQLAERLYDATAKQTPGRRDNFSTAWRPTRFEDYTQEWFLTTCKSLHIAPILHRKIWEEVYVVNTLENAGKLAPGMRGICFGVGQERLPAYFASRGARVLGTDLAPSNQDAASWINTDQHGSLEKLFHEDLVTKDQFDSLVEFQYADMNNISPALHGQFDFCWSICAFEHLGSIENGLRFVENSGKLLKAGGIAVHTTEYNYSSNDQTIDNWGTVLFRRKDFESLAERLINGGYRIPSLDFDVGSTPMDQFIDVPPYPGHRSFLDSNLSPLHLKLLVDGFPATCFGLNFSRGSRD